MKNFKIKFILIFGWSLFGFSILFSTMKTQLVLSNNLKEFTSKLFPQGWGFFTKNPRDFVLNCYKIKNGKLELIDISNQSLKNHLGFSRSARIIGYEMSIIAGDIKNTDWKQNSDGNIYNNINDTTITINNKYLFKHLTKGDYLIKLNKPVPYAWSKYNQEKFNPFSIAKISIK
jgi:antimicrobial peptide system SdpA family protein